MMTLYPFLLQMGEQRPKRPPSESSAELVVEARAPDPEARPTLPSRHPTSCQEALPHVLHNILHSPTLAWQRRPKYNFWEETAPVNLSSFHNRRYSFSWAQENSANGTVYRGLPSVVFLRHWLPVVIICLNSEPPTIEHTTLYYPVSLGTQLQKKYVTIKNTSSFFN